MRYRIIYEKAQANFGAYSPDLPGCVALADTLDECRTLMREAIALHLKRSRMHGDPVPPDPRGYVEILDFEPERKGRRSASRGQGTKRQTRRRIATARKTAS